MNTYAKCERETHTQKRMRARSFAHGAHVIYDKANKIRLTFHFLQKK